MAFSRKNISLLLRGAGLVLLVLITYSPVVHNGWIWDDDYYITQNTTLRTSGGLKRIWTQPSATPQYYPLTFTSFWFEEHLFGLSPVGFHLDNILFHVCNVLLLWLILRRLRVPAAWLIAALWGVHPVNVESVAWASERKNLLSTFFYLLAFWVYWPLVENETPGRVGRYFLSLFLFLLSLLAKTVSATFPGAVLLLTWWKLGRIRWRDVLLMIPFIAIALPMSAITSHIERTFVGARGPEFVFSPWQRGEIAARAAWFYVGKDVYPVHLSFIYPRWQLDHSQIIYLIAFLAAIFVLALLARRFGRGVMVGPLFFLGTLLPALGFVNVYPMRFSFVADHFQYLASAGVIAAVIAAIYRAIGQRWIKMPITRIAASVILATWALLAFHRSSVFADSITLWSDALARNPDSWMVRTNLGTALLERGQNELDHQQTFPAARDFSAAQIEFEQAHQIRGDLTEPIINLARIEELEGHFAASERWLGQALAINPDSADVHFHLGAVLVKAGRVNEGIAEYSKAVLLDPRHMPAWVNLGVALDMAGKTEPAIEAYLQALKIDPDSLLARTNLGNAYLKLHRPSDAAEQFRRALAIEPNFPPAAAGLRAATGQ